MGITIGGSYIGHSVGYKRSEKPYSGKQKEPASTLNIREKEVGKISGSPRVAHCET